jgi:hypothetical protein
MKSNITKMDGQQHIKTHKNKHRDWKITKYNYSFEQNAGIQKELFATYKQNVL